MRRKACQRSDGSRLADADSALAGLGGKQLS